LGIPTFTTSVSPRSSISTPDAVRRALARFSTWSYSLEKDLRDFVSLVDYGNVEEPDGEGGSSRVATAVNAIDDSLAMTIFLGGDNAATWHALRSLAHDRLSEFGLITLDAHLDMREGVSNGSPVRQLLDEGLDAHHVVQVGLADFSNSASYAKHAREAGVTIIPRAQLHHRSIADVASEALAIAGEGNRPVYVDIDVDVADRSVVPGCPAAAPGGLSADEIRRFVGDVAAHENVRAIDITEIDVDRDSGDERTVRLGALLVLEALAGVVRRRA
jgi:formiminoglutamase